MGPSSIEQCSSTTVRGLFADTRLELPSGFHFEWSKRRWGPLLRDWLLAPSAQGLFLGPLVIAKRTDDSPRVETVDGAHRLVVAALTLAALRQIGEELGRRDGEGVSQLLAIAEFGAPLQARVSVANEPESSALRHWLLEPSRNPPASARGSKLTGLFRAIRKWLDETLAESDDLSLAYARLLQRALDGGEFVVTTLSAGHDLDRERKLMAPRAPRPSTALAAGYDSYADSGDQWDLEHGLPTELPKLSPELTHAGTVWIPRILWALEWALRHRLGPQSASDIARLLHDHAFLAVANTNIARAFRHHRKDPECQKMWRESEPLRYEILSHGRRVLGRVLESTEVTSS